MKGLIYDIKRFALHDGPGIRTTVFFKGCPLDCWWCHNPESRKSCVEKSIKTTWLDGKQFETTETTGEKFGLDELMEELRKDKAFMEESGGGVTFSGGEPLLQYAFLEVVLKKCRLENIHTAIDTSGYSDPGILQRIAALTDLFLFDLKLIEEEPHIAYTGVSNHVILRNLEYLHQQNIPLIIRVPVIPGITDGSNLEKIIAFLSSTLPGYKEVHLLPYHTIAAHKYERFGIENRMGTIPALRESDLIPLADSFKKTGFNVKIGG